MGDSLREDFERDGYVVFDPGIPAETLSDAVTDLEGEFKPPPKLTLPRRLGIRLGRSPYRPFSYRDANRIQDAWKVSPAVKEIARAPVVLDLLREFYDREPLPFQTLNFRVGTQQAPHADAFHFNSDPPGFMCGVWVALEEHRRGFGTTRLLRRQPAPAGGHGGRRPIDGPDRGGEYGKYESYVGEQISRNGFEPRVGLLKKRSGIALVVQSPPWRLAEAGPRTHPQKPGDALLLRGLPLLDADAVSARQDAPAQPEFHHLTRTESPNFVA